MMTAFNAIRISRKLPMTILLLAAGIIFTNSLLSFVSSRDALVAQAREKLGAFSILQERAVLRLFETIDRDLLLMAENPGTIDALRAFNTAFAEFRNPERDLQRIYIDSNPNPAGAKDNLVDARTADSYSALHARFHPVFDRLQNEMGYYDVFLFDTKGNLVYSVFKETDFATNMLAGRWKNSGLATVFRRAMEVPKGGAAVFEDFAPYEPSFDAPASFIARPVFSPDGTRLGVLAYQMPVDALNATVSDTSGLGTSADAYAIGTDRLLRTDARQTSANDILATRQDNATVDTAFDGAVMFAEQADENGTRAVSIARPIDFLGVRWVLVVRENSEDLFAPVIAMRNQIALQGIVMLLVTAGVAILLARNVTLPITGIGAAMDRLARKEYDFPIPATGRGDEIGKIARTLDNYRATLIEGAAAAREAAFKGTAFNTVGAPMLMTDVDYNITHVNDALTRMMKERAEDFRTQIKGFDPTALIGKNMDTFHVTPGRQRTRMSRPENLPVKLKIAIGKAYVGLRVDGVFDENGSLIGYVLEWKDQTSQMKSQTLLQAIDASQVRVEMELDGTVSAVNQTFCNLAGMGPTDLVGRDGSTSIMRDSDDTSLPDIWSEVRAGRSVFGHFRVELGGLDSVFEGSLSPLPNHKGETAGVVLLGADVTEQRKAMQAAEARQLFLVESQSLVVKALQDSLHHLANGRLTASIQTEFSEEYEPLRSDYNLALSKLLEAMKGVVLNASLIRSEAVEISAAADNLSKRTENQAATLEETAAALDQLTASVKSAAQGAAKAAEIVNEARSNAEASGGVVREAVSAMSEIEESSLEISKIISVIDDIAFQTNLLALNAGVEAARAGDSGRGFAVVASEVRALAQRSSEAAQEISALISSSGGQVKRGVSLVGDAGEALKRIVSSVSDIADHVSHLARSSAEQSAGLAEINAAISQLDRATQQNAAMVEETTAASHALTREAETLTETTSRFGIGEDPVATRRNRAEAPADRRSTRAKAAPATVGNTALAPDPGDWDDF